MGLSKGEHCKLPLTLCRQGKSKESGQQMAIKERTQNKFLKIKNKTKNQNHKY